MFALSWFILKVCVCGKIVSWTSTFVCAWDLILYNISNPTTTTTTNTETNKNLINILSNRNPILILILSIDAAAAMSAYNLPTQNNIMPQMPCASPIIGDLTTPYIKQEQFSYPKWKYLHWNEWSKSPKHREKEINHEMILFFFLFW